MDDEDGRDRRLVVARHAAIGGEGDRSLSRVLDLVGDRDHVMLVDRNRAGENHALGIGVGEGDRGGFRQLLAACQRPDGGRTGNAADFLCSNKTEFGEVAVLGVGGREQRDDRARVIDGLMVILEPDVIETGAGEIDRTGDGVGVDGHTLGSCNRLFTGRRCGGLRRRGGRCAFDGCTRRGTRCRLLLLRRLLLLLRLAGLFGTALLLDTRIHVKELPGEDDDNRKGYRDEVIAVLFHHSFLERVSWDRFGFAVPSMRSARRD
ncbi:hypothetical protein D3C78_985840 [compost metagenome]